MPGVLCVCVCRVHYDLGPRRDWQKQGKPITKPVFCNNLPGLISAGKKGWKWMEDWLYLSVWVLYRKPNQPSSFPPIYRSITHLAFLFFLPSSRQRQKQRGRRTWYTESLGIEEKEESFAGWHCTEWNGMVWIETESVCSGKSFSSFLSVSHSLTCLLYCLLPVSLHPSA